MKLRDKRNSHEILYTALECYKALTSECVRRGKTHESALCRRSVIRIISFLVSGTPARNESEAYSTISPVFIQVGPSISNETVVGWILGAVTDLFGFLYLSVLCKIPFNSRYGTSTMVLGYTFVKYQGGPSLKTCPRCSPCIRYDRMVSVLKSSDVCRLLT